MATVKANVNVKIDAGIKDRATQLYARMGLDMTTAIEIFLRQSLAENGLPFKPSAEKSLDEKLAEALKKKASVKITLPTDENGNMYVDKEKYPDLYDWAVNG
ncbi:MAG: type II toxin-antitoxin system RelB/DinJ family antitoxin [Ruminococcus sp.]|jgi:DNA-damage-inducible protein J|nr:type II toxin-antitoxin system RelB/DinJ family antitoxin [Ruminococcus sp.]